MATDSAFRLDVQQFVLIMSRLAGVFLFMPAPGVRLGGGGAKLTLCACLAMSFSRGNVQSSINRPPAEYTLVALALEFVLGLTIGFIVAMMGEVLSCAMQFVAFQAGFSYATTIDPSSDADGGVLLVAAQLFSGLLFFALELDQVGLRAFAASLQAFPPGQEVAEVLTLQGITGVFSSAVTMGTRLALPALVMLVSVDVCLAVLGRFQAQMQLLSLAFPLKLLLSLLLVAGTAGILSMGARRIAEGSAEVLRRLGLA
jgi:flagellar biosynthetic protein FliR